MDSFKIVSKYMQESPTLEQDILFIVVAAVSIGLLWVGITLWDRYITRGKSTALRYETLFVELSHAHRLAADESAWLQSVAVKHGYDDPARLFYTPKVLERELPSGGDAAETARTLLKKLFGREVPEETAGNANASSLTHTTSE